MSRTILAKIIAALFAAAAALFLSQPAQAQEKTKTERLLGESLNEFAHDENGWTHLHWAALANDAEAVRKLLQAGAIPSPLARGDNSPFSVDGKIKAGLLGHDMEKWTNQKQTPIAVADVFKNAAVVSIFVGHGVSILDAYRGILPPETEHFQAGKLDISSRRGNGSTHLHLAVGYNDLIAVRWLIANGADVNAKTNDGFVPLHGAAAENATEIVALLLENGAEVNAKVRRLDLTPLHFAAVENAIETAALLLENGAEVNAKGDDDITPLHVATVENAIETAALLLENGAEVNAKSDDDITPLHVAAARNAIEIAALLLKNGANVNAKENDWTPWTPMDYAIYREHTEMKSLLERHGGRCNKKC